MKIEIKNRFSGEVLFCHDVENNTIRLTLEAAIRFKISLGYADLRSANLGYADLRSADLDYADLRYADLRYADLRSADLGYADLRSAEYGEAPMTHPPLHILGLTWPVMILDTHIKIGCELHATTEWEEYDITTIAGMDNKAEAFWTKYRDLILMAAKLHQNS